MTLYGPEGACRDIRQALLENLPARLATLNADWLAKDTGHTNLLKSSEDLSSASWTALGGATVNVNVSADPDGNTTADDVVAIGSGDGVQQTVAIDFSGDTLTASAYMSGAGTVTMTVEDSAGSPDGSGTAHTLAASMTRFTHTHTFGAGISVPVIFRLDVSGALTWAVWGSQLETGETASAYDPVGVQTLADIDTIHMGPLSVDTVLQQKPSAYVICENSSLPTLGGGSTETLAEIVVGAVVIDQGREDLQVQKYRYVQALWETLLAQHEAGGINGWNIRAEPARAEYTSQLYPESRLQGDARLVLTVNKVES